MGSILGSPYLGKLPNYVVGYKLLGYGCRICWRLLGNNRSRWVTNMQAGPDNACTRLVRLRSVHAFFQDTRLTTDHLKLSFSESSLGRQELLCTALEATFESLRYSSRRRCPSGGQSRALKFLSNFTSLPIPCPHVSKLPNDPGKGSSSRQRSISILSLICSLWAAV